MSRYLAPPGSINIEISERQIPSLFKRFEDELDKKNDNKIFWATGGIAWYLITGAAAYGWTFFEYRGIKKDGSTFLVAIGIASVEVDYRTNPTTVVAKREMAGWSERILFYPSEPRLGTFSVLSDGKYLYAYGHKGGDYNGDYDVVLGRVPLELAKARACWEYWGENKGDLMVTWSEGGSAGNIVAVKIRFEQGIGRAQPKELKLVQRIVEEIDNDNIALSELQLHDELYSFERYEKDGEQKNVIATPEKKNVFEKVAAAFGKLCNKNID
ncbi:hypothetical protein DID88_004954 [Monilinia fructigena]|uniref:Uncharacterized protein n=1 Tax=Monilinia fructigena TaxID=38457 RepID=A0A395IS22_9HELO|nr:hypothetical protein DID88_004954 [Monilinia fructigena]